MITYKMVIPVFSVQNALKMIGVFEETFLLADTSIEVILRILFLTLSNTNLRFAKKELK